MFPLSGFKENEVQGSWNIRVAEYVSFQKHLLLRRRPNKEKQKIANETTKTKRKVNIHDSMETFEFCLLLI